MGPELWYTTDSEARFAGSGERPANGQLGTSVDYDVWICSEKRKQMEDSMGKWRNAVQRRWMKAEVRRCWQGGVGGVGGASVGVDL